MWFGSDCGADGFCRDSGVRNVGNNGEVADCGDDVVRRDVEILIFLETRSGRQVGGFGSDA